MSGRQAVVHFIGLGGIGMSGLARVYASRGWQVQGTDAKPSEVLKSLEGFGIRVMIGHDPASLASADLVVYSSSIAPDHPERLAAAAAGKKILHRAEALAAICQGKTTIAVSGTHGKTTTTALVGTMLQEVGRDPSIVVGGLVISFGGNALVGAGPEIVIEADESDSSFLKFSPSLAVITNIEEEHMEHFGSFEKVLDAYRNFLKRLPENGFWTGCGEDERVALLAREGIRPGVLYGFEKKKDFWSASDIVQCPQGRRGISFAVWKGFERQGMVRLKILGRHNALNALAALAIGEKLELPFEAMAAALEKYEGAARRFDIQYEDRETLVADDYAHHPTEIRATLRALKALGRRRVVAVFQPHRYTRAARFMKDFAEALKAADTVAVTDVYSAGEKELPGVNGPAFRDALHAAGHRDAVYVERARVVEWSRQNLKPGDLWVALGAGDIYQASRELSLEIRGKVFESLRGKVLLNEPLARHASLKVGGPADYWIEPQDEEDLARALHISSMRGIGVRVFGAGSNILPPDKGFHGAVIHLAAPYFKKIEAQADGRLWARAGAPNSQFIQTALEAGLGGCEFLMGIPGNIGGSLAMNAGSHGESLDSLVMSLTVLDLKGAKKTLKKTEIPFGYRSSGLKDVVIVEASFLLAPTDRALTKRTLDEYRNYRFQTQDLQHPSAGCMFKNPKEGFSSGRLIEEAGLKGRQIGGAQVSFKHANFIINLGGATAVDIERLIREVQSAVKQKFNVELETEVRTL